MKISPEWSRNKLDTKINLCDSCLFHPYDCSAKESDVKYGDGIGLDNVYSCTVYTKEFVGFVQY